MKWMKVIRINQLSAKLIYVIEWENFHLSILMILWILSLDTENISWILVRIYNKADKILENKTWPRNFIFVKLDSSYKKKLTARLVIYYTFIKQ